MMDTMLMGDSKISHLKILVFETIDVIPQPGMHQRHPTLNDRPFELDRNIVTKKYRWASLVCSQQNTGQRLGN